MNNEEITKVANVSEDKFVICNNECKRLIEKYGYKTSIDSYPEEYRCVVLVWTSMGKIENGGFNYLFETKLPGDPYYKLALESYKKIGCDSSYQVFKTALCLFAECEPPLDDHDRILKYKEAPEEVREKIDADFWNTLDEIILCLSRYIEAL